MVIIYLSVTDLLIVGTLVILPMVFGGRSLPSGVAGSAVRWHAADVRNSLQHQ